MRPIPGEEQGNDLKYGNPAFGYEFFSTALTSTPARFFRINNGVRLGESQNNKQVLKVFLSEEL